MAKINLYKLSTVQKEAAEPQIGIFWIYRGTIYQWSSPVSSIPAVGGFKDAGFNHGENPWDQMVKLHPELQSKEYYQIPRGRVLWRADGIFLIYLPKKEGANKILVQRIARQFNLPLQRVIVQQDEHYEQNMAIDNMDMENLDNMNIRTKAKDGRVAIWLGKLKYSLNRDEAGVLRELLDTTIEELDSPVEQDESIEAEGYGGWPTPW